MTHEFLK